MRPRQLSALFCGGIRALFTLGPRRTLAAATGRLSRQPQANTEVLLTPEMMVAADWTRPPAQITSPRTVSTDRGHLAWITSPPSAGSGGHQNLFRFVRYAELAGYRCTVYLWDWRGTAVDINDMRKMLRATEAFADIDGDVVMYDPAHGVDSGAAAIICSAWETAYVSFLDPSDARRLYFVQDFEPYFYAPGPNSVLAENTYRFGFHGLTAGRWLAEKLHNEYGMETDAFGFGTDAKTYRVTRTEMRDGIFFYGRHTTLRRGYELGIAALSELHRRRPDVPIHLAGGSPEDPVPNFPHTNHGTMGLTELNALYNTCAAALTLSLTNVSLVPLELLSAGVIPVVNDAPNTRLVLGDNTDVLWTPLSVARIVEALEEALDMPRDESALREREAAARVHTWDRAGDDFVAGLRRGLHG